MYNSPFRDVFGVDSNTRANAYRPRKVTRPHTSTRRTATKRTSKRTKLHVAPVKVLQALSYGFKHGKPLDARTPTKKSTHSSRTKHKKHSRTGHAAARKVRKTTHKSRTSKHHRSSARTSSRSSTSSGTARPPSARGNRPASRAGRTYGEAPAPMRRKVSRAKVETRHSATERKDKPQRMSSARKTAKKATHTARTRRSDRSESHNWTSNIKSLSMADVDVGALLGEGAFSKVYLANFKDTHRVRRFVPEAHKKQNLALKVIPRVASSRQSKSMVWERYVLSHLQHPFIVRYFGSFVEDRRMVILLEFTIGGEILFHFESAQFGRFTPDVTRFYTGEIASAIEYCHSQGYIYRDLKPENVLLDHSGHIKLVDFGFAKKLKRDEKTFTLCGSREYVAPEVLTGQGHGFSVDLWSLGVLTYEFLVGSLPFPTQNCSPYEVLDVIHMTHITFPSYVPRDAQDFVQRLLTIAPFRRLGCDTDGFGELKGHEWFTGFDWARCSSGQLEPPILPQFKSEHDVSNFATAKFETSPHDDLSDF